MLNMRLRDIHHRSAATFRVPRRYLHKLPNRTNRQNYDYWHQLPLMRMCPEHNIRAMHDLLLRRVSHRPIRDTDEANRLPVLDMRLCDVSDDCGVPYLLVPWMSRGPVPNAD